MTRNSVQTVTLPVLVPAEDLRNAVDWSPISPITPDESLFVQLLTPEDAKQWLREKATPEDSALYIGASWLKGAFDARDDYAVRKAFEKLKPYVRGVPSPDPVEVNLGDTKSGSKVSLLIGGQNLEAARSWYSGLMTEIFKGTRLVMWFSEMEGRFLPALHCPDWRTAAFVVLFTGRVRVCLRATCNSIFTPLAGNVDYCSPACREAHRVARYRWRIKQRTKAKQAAKST